MNGMLGRIETTYNELDEAYKAQRRFVSDASHELRTPLTTIRGNIELLERMWPPALESGNAADGTKSADDHRMTMTREAMHDIAGEAKRMSNLVNDLLALARADAGLRDGEDGLSRCSRLSRTLRAGRSCFRETRIGKSGI